MLVGLVNAGSYPSVVKIDAFGNLSIRKFPLRTMGARYQEMSKVTRVLHLIALWCEM